MSLDFRLCQDEYGTCCYYNYFFLLHLLLRIFCEWTIFTNEEEITGFPDHKAKCSSTMHHTINHHLTVYSQRTWNVEKIPKRWKRERIKDMILFGSISSFVFRFWFWFSFFLRISKSYLFEQKAWISGWMKMFFVKCKSQTSFENQPISNVMNLQSIFVRRKTSVLL